MKIASMHPASGPVGSVVTITGEGFGDAHVGNTVTMNGMPVTPTHWSDTSLSVKVPHGATDGPVVVQVGTVEENAGRFKVTTELPALKLSAQLRAIAADLESRHL